MSQTPRRRSGRSQLAACLAAPVLCLLLAGTGVAANVVTGGITVHDAKHTGAAPAQGPRIVYVADFRLDATDAGSDSGNSAATDPSGGPRPGLLGRLNQRPLVRSITSPSQQAQDIVDGLASALVKDLADRDIPARRLSLKGTLPGDGWLVQGEFTEVDQGNRLRNAVIGFGTGASSMEAQVAISDLAAADPLQAFLLFGTAKQAGKLPGGIVTRNPYVVAARFVMAKNASGKDIQNTAQAIADQIVASQKTIEEQGAKRHPSP